MPSGCIQKSFYGGQQYLVNSVKNQCMSNADVNLVLTWSDGSTPYVGCYSCPEPCQPPLEINPVTKQCDGPCPEGQVRNLNTGMCEVKTECVYPQLYDSFLNACYNNPNNCAIGAKPNPLVPGTCMATGPTSCPAGWVLSADALTCSPSGTGSSSANSSVPSNTSSAANTSQAASSAQPASSSPTNSSSGSGTSSGSGDGSGSGSGSGSSSGANGGSNSSWTPNSAYGNWIPVDANSNCPNKYQDNTGKWWCWGGQSSTGSSAGGGSNSSGAGLGGEDCESEPQCTMDTMDCAQLIQQWHTRCGGEKLDEKFWELPDQGDDKVTFEKSLKKFKEKLEKLPNVQAITEFFKFNGSGSCPVWAVNVWVFDVVIDQQCSPNIPWNLISGIIIAVASLLAIRIALT